MKKNIYYSLLISAMVSVSVAEETRQVDKHEHGVGELNNALGGTALMFSKDIRQGAFENLDINDNRTFDQLPGNDFFVLVSKEKSVCFHKEWIKEMGKPDQDGKFFYEWTANETSKYIWEHLSN